MGALQPTEGTISKHVALKLAKYSQHSADQLPYDKSPVEYMDAMYSIKYPDKDIMVRTIYAPQEEVGPYQTIPLFPRPGANNSVDSVSVVHIRLHPSSNYLMVCETGS
jgi:hypothetical protein